MNTSITRPSQPRQLPDFLFRAINCAEANHVFLWQACDQPQFMRAVMFERIAPPSSEFGNANGDEMLEGVRIWQHGRKEWVPGMF